MSTPRPLGSYRYLRPLLFRCDAERAHGWALRVAERRARRLADAARGAGPVAGDPRLAQNLLGLHFDNPLGLAAGLDKDGVAIPYWHALGFGFVEVGSVTPRPQPGNERPRLWRHPAAGSLQNAMGFNNAGLAALRARLAAGPFARPVFVNLGKNRDTPLAAAATDYLALIEGLAGLCDGYVVNLSSPNTPGLRELETPAAVATLAALLAQAATAPLLVKLSPDQDPGHAAEVSRAAIEGGAAGIVLTNTTIEYSLLPGVRPVGGLSGDVLRERSYRLLRAVAAALPPGTPIVSVGGIDGAAEAWRRLAAGASLVEIYSALVYAGPGLVRHIVRELGQRLEREGLASLAELVGKEREG